ncbi:MAG TPA: hypothetical protein VFV75_18145 [Candidatus Polarisedimenticolaceae bacterium]|nr:hypothetical protein [Candidatus Polarisedimenticolaceae bacterium]
MSRPLRTIAILLVMGLIAIAALSLMAGRFRAKGAETRRSTETRQVVPPQPDARH